jgi:hypothetical protein
MPGKDPEPGPVSPDANSTPAFARLGLRTPAGWGPLPPEQLLPPPVIPDYTVLRRIGGGAYGEVGLATPKSVAHYSAMRTALPFIRYFRRTDFALSVV